MNERSAFRLRGEDRDQAYQIAREPRPQAGCDLPRTFGPRAGAAKNAVPEGKVDTHALEHGRHDFDIGLANAGNLDLTAGNARHDRPTPSLDVVAPETVFGAVELRAPLDTDRRCARAGDADAALLEEFPRLD